MNPRTSLAVGLFLLAALAVAAYIVNGSDSQQSDPALANGSLGESARDGDSSPPEGLKPGRTIVPATLLESEVEVSPTLLVEVVDEAGLPVSRARVDLHGNLEDHTRLESGGLTDVDGRCSLDSSLIDSGEWTAIASHPDYLIGHALVTKGAKRHVVLLREGLETAIAGVVVFEDGNSAGGGFKVVAWPSGRVFPSDSLNNGGSIDRFAPAALSDDDGRFVIENLDPTLRYRVTAGKPGLLAEEPTRDCAVPPGVTNLVLRVDRLFGALIRLKHQGGRSLRTSPELYGRPGPTWKVDDGLRGRVWLPDSTVALAGIRSSALHTRSIGEHVLLYRACKGGEGRGSVSFDVHVPGYSTFEGSFELYPVEEGLKEYVVELRPEAESWGDLVLAFNGRGHRTWGVVHREVPLAQAVIQGATGDKYNFAVRSFSEFGLLLAGVPAGEYTLRLRNTDHYFHWPPEEDWVERITIGVEPYVHVIDCSLLGDLQLRAIDRGGVEYRGRAVVVSTAVRGSERGTRINTWFDKEPYIVEGITSCQYEIGFARAEDWEVGRVLSAGLVGILPQQLTVLDVRCD